MTPSERLVQAVIDKRKQAGLSQSDLATAMSDLGFRWHQPTVGRVEAGDRPLRFDEALALADLFQIDLSTFRSTSRALCRTCSNWPPVGFTCNRCGRSA